MNKKFLWLALVASLVVGSPKTLLAQHLTPSQKELFETLTPEQREELSKLTPRQLLELSDDNSLEKQGGTFCGVEVGELTDSQKNLYDRLTPEQREELSQKVYINKQDWQIEFTQIKKAIKDRDVDTLSTKKSVDDIIKKLGNGWELPRNVDYTAENKLKLNPEASDYDAMILQMPWATDDEKVEIFRLLTGMDWWYRTAQNYNKSSSRFVLRLFEEGVRDWNRYNDNYTYYYHVRPVRSL